MSFALTLRVALKALARNTLRTALTMLGIVIGVAAVVAMLSIGSGAQQAVKANLESLGANTIEVFPGQKRGRNRGSEGNQAKLKEADWKALARLPEVKASFPMISPNVPVVYGASNWQCPIRGTTNQFFEIQDWPAQKGRTFTESEISSGALVLVLGTKATEELFGSTDPIGETVRVKGTPFRVIGVLVEKGGGERDNMVVAPYRAVFKRIIGEERLGSITLQAFSEEGAVALEKASVDLLNERHHKDPENGGFRAQNRAEAQAVVGESTKIFSMLLGGVASVSLLVGGIGIMNIMLVSVTERVREIGIRMAVGARGRDILSQFLCEAVVISLAGGVVGITLGIGVAYWVAGLADWPFVVSSGGVVLSFGTAAAIGIFFGFYPAYRASQLDPIQALRNG